MFSWYCSKQRLLKQLDNVADNIILNELNTPVFTPCMLCNIFALFHCRLPIFFFQNKLFQDYYQTVKNLDPDQARPESKLSAKVISRCKKSQLAWQA